MLPGDIVSWCKRVLRVTDEALLRHLALAYLDRLHSNAVNMSHHYYIDEMSTTKR